MQTPSALNIDKIINLMTDTNDCGHLTEEELQTYVTKLLSCILTILGEYDHHLASY